MISRHAELPPHSIDLRLAMLGHPMNREARGPGMAPTAGTWRVAALLALVFAPLAALLLAVAPIPQDPAYHALADARAFLGIPNFANVASNAAFLLVGALGLACCLNAGFAGARASWTMFFLGTLLVAFGSAHYHWSPDSNTLVWDRLPMTLGFTGLFTAVLAEHLRPGIERALLPLAIVVGLSSVGWWHYADDLRFYAWVQFSPLASIVLVLLVYPGRYSHRAYWVYGLACYALAKLTELGDHAIYSATSGAISGHSLKHLLAALAAFLVYLMVRARKPLATKPS